MCITLPPAPPTPVITYPPPAPPPPPPPTPPAPSPGFPPVPPPSNFSFDVGNSFVQISFPYLLKGIISAGGGIIEGNSATLSLIIQNNGSAGTANLAISSNHALATLAIGSLSGPHQLLSNGQVVGIPVPTNNYVIVYITIAVNTLGSYEFRADLGGGSQVTFNLSFQAVTPP